MLACSGYFLVSPQFYLTRARKTKITKSNLALYSARKISAKDVSVWGVFVGVDPIRGFFAMNTYMIARLSGISFCL